MNNELYRIIFEACKFLCLVGFLTAENISTGIFYLFLLICTITMKEKVVTDSNTAVSQ